MLFKALFTSSSVWLSLCIYLAVAKNHSEGTGMGITNRIFIYLFIYFLEHDRERNRGRCALRFRMDPSLAGRGGILAQRRS